MLAMKYMGGKALDAYHPSHARGALPRLQSLERGFMGRV
jgi:hypothetical protein